MLYGLFVKVSVGFEESEEAGEGLVGRDVALDALLAAVKADASTPAPI